MEPKGQDKSLADFLNVRPRLFGIAYRRLRNVPEAEDVVQDVWLRWQAADRTMVLDPPAFLATTAARLAVNLAQSARSRYETYVEPWLPEPVDTSTDPQLEAERSEALEFAVLLLLEKLSPTERAAYVLREAFDYPYRQIADILRLEEPNTRQLVARARQRIADRRRGRASSTEQRCLIETFIGAAKGDMAALESLFAADVAAHSNGGGVVRPRRTPIVGSEGLVKFFPALASWFWTRVTIMWIQQRETGTATDGDDC